MPNGLRVSIARPVMPGEILPRGAEQLPMPVLLPVAGSCKDDPEMHPQTCSCFLFGRTCRCDTTDSLDRDGGAPRSISPALVDTTSWVIACLWQPAGIHTFLVLENYCRVCGKPEKMEMACLWTERCLNAKTGGVRIYERDYERRR